MIGGYVIIDLKKIPLTVQSNALTLEQLGKNYFDIIKNTNKVILVENVIYENNLYKPQFIMDVRLDIPTSAEQDKRQRYILEYAGNIVTATAFSINCYDDGSVTLTEN